MNTTSNDARKSVPIWKRGGFYVSKPELDATVAFLQAQIRDLQAEVEALRAALADRNPQ